jgi:hypothetical protein
MVEVKSSADRRLNKNLSYFHERIGTNHAFQLMFDADFEDSDCFEFDYPVRVPAKTFLSQLL